MNKVSIARRRQRIRLLSAQARLETMRLQRENSEPASASFPGGDSLALSRFLAALGEGSAKRRRMGFALELEIDPDDPSRLRVEVIPRPIRTGRFVTVRQAARLLRVSPEAIRRALARGELQGVKVGRQWRVCLERPRWLAKAWSSAGPREE